MTVQTPPDRLAPMAEGSQPGWAGALDRTALALFIAALVWAPWPLGSNRPWAVALLGGLLALALVLAAVARLGLPSTRSRPPGWWLPLAALAGFAGLLVVQTLPGLGDGGGTISIDPFQTRQYLFTTLSYMAAWALVLLLVRSRRRASLLLGAVVTAGVLQAAVAVFLASTNWRYEFLFAEFGPGGRASGTFVNPDHLAGYMELTLAAGLGWLLSQFDGDGVKKARRWQEQLSTMLRFALSPKMLLRLTLVVAVIALVMTHSRMGNGAFFLALFLVGALVAVRSQRLRRPALWLVASMAVVDLLVIGQWVGLDRVVQRMTVTAQATVAEASAKPVAFGEAPPVQRSLSEESFQQRMTVPILSMQLVKARPWLGHGGGSYVTAFPPVKTDKLPLFTLFWDHAHNDYVQVASDTGLLGLLLWLTAGVATAWRAVQLLHDRETPIHRGLGVAALVALSCMGLHSVVDFNLHIPANALTFTVLLAAVWALPGAGRRSRRSSSRAANEARA